MVAENIGGAPRGGGGILKENTTTLPHYQHGIHTFGPKDIHT